MMTQHQGKLHMTFPRVDSYLYNLQIRHELNIKLAGYDWGVWLV